QEKKTTSVDTGKRSKDGKPVFRVKEHVVTDKHFQPDTAAIIFALTNREPEKWKNRVNSELTGKDGKDLSFPAFLIESGVIPDNENR
ncbi:MAG: hypothetical protein LBB90_05300, partial [Tannerella sp.]|nr:hypothetical protein [Tannerella sp.]